MNCKYKMPISMVCRAKDSPCFDDICFAETEEEFCELSKESVTTKSKEIPKIWGGDIQKVFNDKY